MRKFLGNIHKGMTLAELLIVFVIMGIIATMTMVSIKPSEKSFKYVYNRVYNAIGTAFYNSAINISDDLKNDPDMKNGFPESAELFCKVLLEYINTKEGTDHTCSNNTVNINNPVFSNDKVQFVASNSVKFWIGHTDVAGKYSTYSGIDSTNSNYTIKYHIVFADLNGELGPNSAIPHGNGMADIVGFIVTEDFEVVPIGVPETDPRYVVARVVYSTIETGSGTSSEQDMSPTMSVLEAKRRAWGTPGRMYISSNEPLSMNFYDGGKIYSTSPFWIDYNSPKYSAIMNKNADNPCRKTQPPPDPSDPEPPPPTIEVEPDACYVTIQDFY